MKNAGSEFIDLIAFNADYNNSCPTIFALFTCNATTQVRNPYAERYVEGHSKQGGCTGHPVIRYPDGYSNSYSILRF